MTHLTFSIMTFTLIFVASGACNRMTLTLNDASIQPPSNVAIYFAIDDKDGNPVPGLDASQFRIYEDEQLISEHESQQTILNPEVAIDRFTLLLIDMSGSVVEGDQVPIIQESLNVFLDNINEDEQVAFYAFDGREDIIPIAPFGSQPRQLARKNEMLSSFTPKDPSTNLNGAILKAATVLSQQKRKSKMPLKFGTLVVFTDGADRAHRATQEEAMAALHEEQIDSIVIGLSSEADQESQLDAYATLHFVKAGDEDSLTTAFKEVADNINAQSQRYYLLSYCSPARAGTHQLTVEIEANDQTGKLHFDFDATGFKPGCDPNEVPRFQPTSDPPPPKQTKKSSRHRSSDTHSPAQKPRTPRKRTPNDSPPAP